MDVWLSIKELSNLEKISPQAVRKNVAQGKYLKIRQVESMRGGKAGKVWQIHFSCLSPRAQAEHMRSQRVEGMEHGAEEKGQQTSIHFAAAEEKHQLIALARAEMLRALYIKVGVLTRKSRRAQTRAMDRALEAYAAGAWRPEVQYHDGAHDLLGLLGPISRRTIYYWKQALEVGGLDALMFAHGARGRRIPEDIRQEIDRMIWERPRASKKIYDFLGVTFAKRDDLPSYRTVHRYIADYKREFREPLVMAHKGESAWRHKYMPAVGSASAKAIQPNDVWEIDTTPADLMTKDGRRHKIIGLIDVHSRRAIFRLFPSSNGWAIGQTLRAGILTWGIPKTLLKDNGKDYQSRLVNQACDELGIEYPKLPFRAPERKPHIERIFRTLSEGLFAELTGYTGNCLLNRPEEIRLNYTAEALQEILDRWTASVYEEEIHRSTGKRPREGYQMPGFEPRVAASERQLDVLLMPHRQMMVRQGAIRRVIHGQELVYFHEALYPLNGKTVDLKLDLHDAGRIYVFYKGAFVCQAVDPVAEGIPLAEIVAAGKRHKKAVKILVKAEQDLARKGPVDRRIHEYIEAKEAERPAVFPQRVEVIHLEKYEGVEKVDDEAGSASPTAATKERIEVVGLPVNPPDPENDPIFWEDGDPFFMHQWKKFIWCQKRIWKGEEISERTKEWIEEYKQTEDYRFNFVENDGLQLFRWMEKKYQGGAG